MDLRKYIEAMHRFHAREGYYPTFGKPQRRHEQESPEDEAHQPTRPRFIPRSRRRPWK
jgi:hypothetical protein